jgi:hypothetical protein
MKKRKKVIESWGTRRKPAKSAQTELNMCGISKWIMINWWTDSDSSVALE